MRFYLLGLSLLLAAGGIRAQVSAVVALTLPSPEARGEQAAVVLAQVRPADPEGAPEDAEAYDPERAPSGNAPSEPGSTATGVRVSLEEIAGIPEEAQRSESELSATDRKVQAMVDQTLAEASRVDREQTKQDLQGVIQTFPQAYPVARAQYELAMLEDDLPTLLAGLENVVAEHPASVWATEALLQIGEFAPQVGRVDQSLLAFQAYLARRPGAPKAQYVQMRIAECLRQQNRIDEAIAQYEQIVAQYPNHRDAAKVQERIALCLMALKRYDEAVQRIEEVIQGFPGYAGLPALLLNEGLCLEEIGRFDDARTRYNDLVNLYPKSIETELARLRLNDLTQPLLAVQAEAKPAERPMTETPEAIPEATPEPAPEATPRPKMSNTFTTQRPAAFPNSPRIRTAEPTPAAPAAFPPPSPKSTAPPRQEGAAGPGFSPLAPPAAFPRSPKAGTSTTPTPAPNLGGYVPAAFPAP